MSLDGCLVGPLFICLKELNSQFGPNVKKHIPNFPNIVIDCSKCGKMTKIEDIYRYTLDIDCEDIFDESFL